MPTHDPLSDRLTVEAMATALDLHGIDPRDDTAVVQTLQRVGDRRERGNAPRRARMRRPAKELVGRLAAVLAALSREDLRWHFATKLRP
jgi:hypothetical protein